MPSFRASLGIVDALPGVPPEAVLEAARAAVAEVRHVEDSHVDVEPVIRGDGIPRVVVRFVEPAGSPADEDARAWAAATRMATAVREVATTASLRLHRRQRGRWQPRPNPGTDPGW
ncbi:MAG: hypothetical protein AAGC63_06445 [Propionicimonas sp.]|nr:hypothetical protein [Propionicimonas sp.]